jgi:hypothetical protein
MLIASDSFLALWSADASTPDVLPLAQKNTLSAPDIVRRYRVTVVVLEEGFAFSAQAAALVARLQTDPEFEGVELRVLSMDNEEMLRSGKAPDSQSAASLIALTQPLPRRAVRLRPTLPIEILIDGHRATLVNLSQSGTQVCASFVLKPHQHVRLSLPLRDDPIRIRGVVVWSALELSEAPTYRAGIKLMPFLPLSMEEIRSRL